MVVYVARGSERERHIERTEAGEEDVFIERGTECSVLQAADTAGADQSLIYEQSC